MPRYATWPSTTFTQPREPELYIATVAVAVSPGQRVMYPLCPYQAAWNPSRPEGTVAGGVHALPRPTKALEGRAGDNDDQTRGIEIVRKSLTTLVRQIASNAGHDGAVVSGKLLEGNDPTIGFNAQTEKYENLVESGVIDPTKVVRQALQNAASISGLLLTTEAIVAEISEEDEGHSH